jgi:hypothetical protein
MLFTDSSEFLDSSTQVSTGYCRSRGHQISELVTKSVGLSQSNQGAMSYTLIVSGLYNSSDVYSKSNGPVTTNKPSISSGLEETDDLEASKSPDETVKCYISHLEAESVLFSRSSAFVVSESLDLTGRDRDSAKCSMSPFLKQSLAIAASDQNMNSSELSQSNAPDTSQPFPRSVTLETSAPRRPSLQFTVSSSRIKSYAFRVSGPPGESATYRISSPISQSIICVRSGLFLDSAPPRLSNQYLQSMSHPISNLATGSPRLSESDPDSASLPLEISNIYHLSGDCSESIRLRMSDRFSMSIVLEGTNEIDASKSITETTTQCISNLMSQSVLLSQSFLLLASIGRDLSNQYSESARDSISQFHSRSPGFSDSDQRLTSLLLQISSICGLSDVYSMSIQLTASDEFTMSTDLEGTNGLDVSIWIDRTKKQSISNVMSRSVLFSQSFALPDSITFGLSNLYSESLTHSASHLVAGSLDFSESDQEWTLLLSEISNAYQLSDVYSKSIRLTTSGKFSMSTHLEETSEIYVSKSIDETMTQSISCMMSQSILFSRSSAVVDFTKFDLSNQYSDSRNYLISHFVAKSIHFSESDQEWTLLLSEISNAYQLSDVYSKSIQLRLSVSDSVSTGLQQSDGAGRCSMYRGTMGWAISRDVSESILFSRSAACVASINFVLSHQGTDSAEYFVSVFLRPSLAIPESNLDLMSLGLSPSNAADRSELFSQSAAFEISTSRCISLRFSVSPRLLASPNYHVSDSLRGSAHHSISNCMSTSMLFPLSSAVLSLVNSALSDSYLNSHNDAVSRFMSRSISLSGSSARLTSAAFRPSEDVAVSVFPSSSAGLSASGANRISLPLDLSLSVRLSNICSESTHPCWAHGPAVSVGCLSSESVIESRRHSISRLILRSDWLSHTFSGVISGRQLLLPVSHIWRLSQFVNNGSAALVSGFASISHSLRPSRDGQTSPTFVGSITLIGTISIPNSIQFSDSAPFTEAANPAAGSGLVTWLWPLLAGILVMLLLSCCCVFFLIRRRRTAEDSTQLSIEAQATNEEVQEGIEYDHEYWNPLMSDMGSESTDRFVGSVSGDGDGDEDEGDPESQIWSGSQSDPLWGYSGDGFGDRLFDAFESPSSDVDDHSAIE